MADIELVIKIDEEDYEIMKHNIAVDNPLCPLSEKEMVSKVANGIPLPKEHGRLIDADYVLEKLKNYCENNCVYSKEVQNIMCSSCAIGDAIDIVEDAPTIKK